MSMIIIKGLYLSPKHLIDFVIERLYSSLLIIGRLNVKIQITGGLLFIIGELKT